jgi:hypothetical protein
MELMRRFPNKLVGGAGAGCERVGWRRRQHAMGELELTATQIRVADRALRLDVLDVFC